jgi:hypothetical protein
MNFCSVRILEGLGGFDSLNFAYTQKTEKADALGQSATSA